MVEVFGDGSNTYPTKWWAAMGGQGVWIKDWNLDGENRQDRKGQHIAEPALGQTSNSTRQELAAWIITLTRPFRSHYATDSESMKGKANHLLAVAADIEAKELDGKKVHNKANPYRRAWGLQRDGDLWELAWMPILTRGGANHKVRKVKGHATKKEIGKRENNENDKEGNRIVDEYADIKGVKKVGGPGLVKLGAWLAKRHDAYIAFMRRVQRMIVAITKAEQGGKAEAKHNQKRRRSAMTPINSLRQMSI